MAELVNGSPAGAGNPGVRPPAKTTQGTLNFGLPPLDSPLGAQTIRKLFAEKVPWRARLLSLALVVGLLTGVVCVLYEVVMDFVIEKVWQEGGPLFAATFPGIPAWTYIPLVCISFGTMVGVLIRLLGEPMANLPGVVLAAHRDGLLGHEEAPAMAAISLTSIVAGGSLGPEAPLVSIGGGLASFISLYVDLSEAETLFVTMCGMGAGLGARTRARPYQIISTRRAATRRSATCARPRATNHMERRRSVCALCFHTRL